MPATTPKSAGKKRRSSSGIAAASPRASTSRDTLDREDEHAEQGEKEGDNRFAAFLEENEVEEGGRDGAVNLDEATGEFQGDEGSTAKGEDSGDKELSERDLLARTTLPEHLLPRSLKKGAKTPGLVYLSRIPPGMGPASVRDLMSRYGDVGRLYLEPANKEKGASRGSCLSTCTRALEADG